MFKANHLNFIETFLKNNILCNKTAIPDNLFSKSKQLILLDNITKNFKILICKIVLPDDGLWEQ